jgi:hypothetical protein
LPQRDYAVLQVFLSAPCWIRTSDLRLEDEAWRPHLTQ